MRLYLSVGPNPRVVRMALIEKGMKFDTEVVDIIKGDNRRPPYAELNPAGFTPCLKLDDGRTLAESVAIVEYLEELQPLPSLIGVSREERALHRMRVRQIDFGVVQPMTMGFRAAEGLPMFSGRLRCFPQAADDLKAAARDGLAWLDGQVDDRAFLTGDEIRLADLLLFSFMDFGRQVGQPFDPGSRRLAAWFDRMQGRASALESAAPPA